MENNIDTIIGIHVTIKGNLYNKGSIQVNGNVEGELKSDEDIIVGETAKITGPVVAKKIEVSGEIHGLVQANDKLEIHPTGKVYGDLNAKVLIIKEGALFVGQSAMPANAAEKETPKEKVEAPAIKPTEKKEEPADRFGFFSKK